MYAVVSCMYDMFLCNEKLPILTVNAFMRIFQQYKQHIISSKASLNKKQKNGKKHSLLAGIVNYDAQGSLVLIAN